MTASEQKACCAVLGGWGGCITPCVHCCVTHRWQPGRCRSEHVCTYSEGAEAEQREGHEESAPGSQRVPQRAGTIPGGTPPTAPTAATHTSPSKSDWKPPNARSHPALEPRGLIKTAAHNYRMCLVLWKHNYTPGSTVYSLFSYFQVNVRVDAEGNVYQDC